MTSDQRKIISLKRQIVALKKRLGERPTTSKPNGPKGRGAATIPQQIEALRYAQQVGYRPGQTFTFTDEDYRTRRWEVVQNRYTIGGISVREVL